MPAMKVLIAGLGSVGQRHARNLRRLLGDRVELLAWRVRGRRQVLGAGATASSPEDEYGIRTFARLDEALAERPLAVIVANPTANHVETAQAAADAGCHLFIEKPLGHRWEGIEALQRSVQGRGLVAMVGYQMRYHPALLRLREWLAAGEIGRQVSARLDFGEYLPGWHPYEDYRESYAAVRAMGGGVLLTQIHEFDYAVWLWGMPERVYAAGGQFTDLELDVEDVVSVTLEYPAGAAIRLVHVHLDYLRRPPVRGCEILGQSGRLSADLRSGAVTRLAIDGTVNAERVEVDRDEMFINELRHFLECLEGRAQPRPDLAEGALSLRIALAAQQSLASRQPVEMASQAG